MCLTPVGRGLFTVDFALVDTGGTLRYLFVVLGGDFKVSGVGC